ncbi:MAG: hypothetical protein ACK50G_01595 [bacterium]|jgi:hypothetical protein
MNFIPLYGGARCPKGQSWREQNANLFPSDTSLRWFTRQHGRRLVEQGALVKLRDTWLACEPAMSDAVLAIARESAGLKASA